MILIISILIILILNIILSIHITKKEKFSNSVTPMICNVATSPNQNMCDINMKVSCKWGFQWIYYLQNINQGDTTIPLEIIGYILPSKCNAKPCMCIGMIQYSFGFGQNRISGKKINMFELIEDSQFKIEIDDFKIERKQNFLDITIPPLKTFSNIQIYDNSSELCPQGDNGFVQSGPSNLDTAYSCSFLHTICKNNNKQIGIGYGEFVKGTFPPKHTNTCCHQLVLTNRMLTNSLGADPNLAGWHCFYLHFTYNNTQYDVQACRSKWKNMDGDPYSRMNVIFNGKCNNHLWCECANANCKTDTAVQWDQNDITSWTSPNSGKTYEIGFTLYVPKTNSAQCGDINTDNFFEIKAVPNRENAEVLDGLTKYAWFGTTTLYYKNQKVGVGITEVFKF